MSLSGGPRASPSLYSLLSPPEDELLAEQGSVIAMANRLQWKYVVVVLDNDFLMERFNEALAREDICVVANIFINTNKYEFSCLMRMSFLLFSVFTEVMI